MGSGFPEGTFRHDIRYYNYDEYFIVKIPWRYMQPGNKFLLENDLYEYLEQISPSFWKLGSICSGHWVEIYFKDRKPAFDLLMVYSV